ncbi:MAG: urea ABC transporter permease subunit UrtB [Abitibacteriaceae bacterium]|nr:urea ABC transporter permease subunit UrtB [Abditibacteriaceae bacterium]MBV9868927.1 urea ABC transporter permease subunit UrtB [Abditibacteriaceae bacterium]
MNSDAFISNLFNSLSLGSILLLIALGLAITFGLMRVINMAHGEFIMAGAYVAYVTQNLFHRLPAQFFGWFLIVALPCAFLVTAVMGWLLEMTVIRRLYGRPLDTLLATWGVSIMLQQLARSIFGSMGVNVETPAWLDGHWQMGHLAVPYNRVFIMVVALVCLAGMYLFLYYSHTGRRIQAVMQNRDMAACLGISTRKIDALAFAVGSGLAGIAGCALTLLSSIDSNLGTKYIVDSFMVVVLGGVGRLIGTVAGAIGMGALNTGWEYETTASLGKVLTFVCVMLFLQWKPMGMFTTRTRALD